MELKDNIAVLKGIGKKTSDSFKRLHIDTIQDLLGHYPRDYEMFEDICPIAKLRQDEIAAVRAVVKYAPEMKKVRNLSILTFQVSDGTGEAALTFFNMPFLKNTLRRGGWYIVRGKVLVKQGRFVMEQPKLYKEEEYNRLRGSLQPVYGLTEGITNNLCRKAIRQALENIGDAPECIPEEIRRRHNLMPMGQAYWAVHFPGGLEQLTVARKRLVFEEFFLFLLAVRFMKDKTAKQKSANRLQQTGGAEKLVGQLPYRLTGAQQRVWKDIQKDLQGEYVMNRLVQGDVGSGKTIVALLALLMCAENGFQGALMAPTEVLAAQHFESVTELTEKYQLSFRPVLITGSMKAKEKREAYEKAESGLANLIIGTHALIQEKVTYKNLALVVTDEQHRFGVRQREALAGKGENVHILVMSATPIPRTLAIILYGDLQISVMDELPAERKPIKNCVVTEQYHNTAYRFIEKEIHNGRQAYVICPMVEEGEMEGVENVTDYTEKLKAELAPDIKIGCLHGRMKNNIKEHIMNEFKQHNLDVLVSTTVIEVGINVPNATVMMIENAERFGLAQLHQLRGRVGRGEEQSYCIFVSGNDKKETMKRLEVLNKSNDGFYIAEEDLKLRGPGDLFGVRQSGMLEFKIADIYQDSTILQDAAAEVEELLGRDADLSATENAGLREYFNSKNSNLVDFPII